MDTGPTGLGDDSDDERATGLVPTSPGWPVTRREVLAAVGGAGLTSAVGAQNAATVHTDAAEHGDVRVRVYPGVVPLHARVWYGTDDLRGVWPEPLAAAANAIEDAFDQVLAYAREHGRLADLELYIERGDRIRFPPTETPFSSEAVLPSLETVLERFRDRLRARDALDGRTCHVLLDWSPLNYRVGYGGTLSPHATVGTEHDGTSGDAQAVANVGATEVWDSRAVTRNMVIHETLHTFLEADVVTAIDDAVCDHELGAAVSNGDGTLRVSPMATAYAGPDRIGGGTRFHGTGCGDRSRFYRHDGLEGIDEWTYTTGLSDATCEGVTRTLERRFEA
ncbi:hypothetical protein [Halopiger djelfimassiliensis]|uniref:hypothetical protein n=1 Tax=Halopiger djelfimassiliensis TaxID=1293047 RepID=UPI0009DC04F1|nr:hypothetical protein [Halopiger djelfimassiliensis]